jgi:hypothetical protein
MIRLVCLYYLASAWFIRSSLGLETKATGKLAPNAPAQSDAARTTPVRVASNHNDTNHHAAGRSHMLRSCDALFAKKMREHEALKAYIEETEKTRSLALPEVSAYDFYEPEWTCESEFRLGMNPINVGDGPKFVCAPDMLATQKDCLVYSIGSNYDTSFERGVRKYGPECEIHTFDGTMHLKARPLGKDFEETKINFHNYNFGTADSTSGRETKTFSTIVNSLGHKGRSINLFKIDCEGCEYSTIPLVMKAIADGLVSIHQILIEVHHTNAKDIQKLFQSMRAQGFMIFHKERNQWGCAGYKCVEFALIHESFAKPAFVHSHCPPDSPLRRQLVAEGWLAV